jgi:23S rRNA (adenine2503-C2)-methyltransferase
MAEKLIYDLSFSDLQDVILSWGEPSYRARQVWAGIYKNLWQRQNDFSNLPKNLRLKLFESFTFTGLEPITVQNSTDGETQKTLFHLADQRPLETVRMRYQKRRTLCISTQSGCGMGCTFCATGQMGFLRNLSSGEIVEQVLFYARRLAENGDRVTNIVFMGMGEPFHNYQNVMAAIDTLNHPDGLNLGARRFTISTVGLVPAIQRFTRENSQINLAVSLHAADDELRSSMLPINKKYPLNELMTALREYSQTTRRRVTFEWALIQGVNDSPDQARRLAGLLPGITAHVNVIPLNPTRGFTGQASTLVEARAFQQILEERGIACTIRMRRGIDIQAGCGQLASRE